MTPQERLEERLSAYLDGEATSDERSAVEAELAASAEAREILDDLRLVRSALSALDDVRAPRSFALPPPAAGWTRRVTLTRRLEVFVRASAATAALFFVVAVVSQPSAPGTATADDVAIAQFSAPAGVQPEVLRAAESGPEEKGVAPMFAPDSMQPAAAPAPPDGAPPPPSTGGVPGEGGVMGAGGTDGGGAGGAAEPFAADAPSPQPAPGDLSTRTLPAGTPMVDEPGTIQAPRASQGVGGVAPALATLAVLLGLLSALMAWSRREDEFSR